MKTIINLFHPNFKQSRVNKRLADQVKGEFEVRNLAELYPDFMIDVKKEQQVLEKADRVVLQFPMQWYSSPALLKQWENQVLTYGWAYGNKGTALHGKELLIAITVGADNYGHDDFVGYTIDELLRPLQATSHLIGMRYLKPFAVMGASSISDENLQKAAEEYEQYLQKDVATLGTFE